MGYAREAPESGMIRRGGVQRGQRGLWNVCLRNGVIMMRQLGVEAGRARAVSAVWMRRHGQVRICRCLHTKISLNYGLANLSCNLITEIL